MRLDAVKLGAEREVLERTLGLGIRGLFCVEHLKSSYRVTVVFGW